MSACKYFPWIAYLSFLLFLTIFSLACGIKALDSFFHWMDTDYVPGPMIGGEFKGGETFYVTIDWSVSGNSKIARFCSLSLSLSLCLHSLLRSHFFTDKSPQPGSMFLSKSNYTVFVTLFSVWNVHSKHKLTASSLCTIRCCQGIQKRLYETNGFHGLNPMLILSKNLLLVSFLLTLTSQLSTLPKHVEALDRQYNLNHLLIYQQSLV